MTFSERVKKMTMNEIAKLHDEGKTYREIAKISGMTYQNVWQKHTCFLERQRTGKRNGFNIKDIPYRGFYEYFTDNMEENITTFSIKIKGCFEQSFYNKLKNTLNGTNNSFFKVAEIKKMCEITGKTFERLFEEREVQK